MSYNGSGTFQINTSGQPVVAGTVISSTAFNALTADLATGLSTAITKDGQTATTVRIPFAAGISSTLVTDSSSTSTGSIITAGGVGIAKALYVGTTANVASTTDSSSISTGSIVTAGGVGIAKNLYVGVNANVAGTLGVTGVATFSAAPIYSSLTASSAVATDASKALVSVTNTGTGNNVLATSPTLVTPILGAASATSVTVDAGAVGTPSITTTGDTNTGIFFPAADTIAFSEGGAEAMRINSSGSVLIGRTTGNADARFTPDGGSTDSSPSIDFSKGSATTTTAQVYARFWCNNLATATGSITANGAGAATFTGYSDRRLKENIVNLPSQLSNIMALRPVEFDFKGYENGEGHQIGFIAQEVQEIYPDLVGEGADGMLTLSDMNKNDARLIKAIQEQQAIITALIARITALENK